MSKAHTSADDRESVREAVTDTSRRMLPWTVSLLMHLGLVLLAVFLVWSTLTPPEPEQAVVDSGIYRMPDITFDVPKLREPSEDERGGRRIPNVSTTPASHASSVTNARTRHIIGLGLPTAGSSAGALGLSGVDVGKGRMFDPSSLPPAKRIAFVIDASGSLIDTLPFVLLELSRAIATLHEDQRFVVIFFSGSRDGRPAVMEAPGGMQLATAANKQRVIEWIDPLAGRIVPIGITNPVEALTRAAGHRPELIHLLSDNITGRGRYEISQDELLGAVRRLTGGRVKVNAIQFVYPDPLTLVPGMRGTMERIAEETGGQYRYVEMRDLYLR